MGTKKGDAKTAWAQLFKCGQSTVQKNVRMPEELFHQALAGETKTFSFSPFTVANTSGTPLATSPRSTIVLYRAPHANGGYDAYVAINVFLTSDGWNTRPGEQPAPAGVYVVAQFETGQNAVLFQVKMPGFAVGCGDNDVSHFYQSSIDPDLFDITSEMGILVLGGYNWWRC